MKFPASSWRLHQFFSAVIKRRTSFSTNSTEKKNLLLMPLLHRIPWSQQGIHTKKYVQFYVGDSRSGTDGTDDQKHLFSASTQTRCEKKQKAKTFGFRYFFAKKILSSFAIELRSALFYSLFWSSKRSQKCVIRLPVSQANSAQCKMDCPLTGPSSSPAPRDTDC